MNAKQADPNGIWIVRVVRLTYQSVSADICTPPLLDVMLGLAERNAGKLCYDWFEH